MHACIVGLALLLVVTTCTLHEATCKRQKRGT